MAQCHSGDVVYECTLAEKYVYPLFDGVDQSALATAVKDSLAVVPWAGSFHLLALAMLGGAVLMPPEMGEGDCALIGLDDGRDVLGGVAGCLPECYSRGDLETLRRSRRPNVGFVVRPVVVDPGVGEEGDVDRVIGVVMRHDHVGDFLGHMPEFPDRVQDPGGRGDHARVDDHQGLLGFYQRDRGGDPPSDVAVCQHVHSGHRRIV